MTAWRVPDDCLATAWWLLDDCLGTAWQLPDDCLTTAWQLPDDCDGCLMTALWLPDDCLTTAWRLPDDCPTIWKVETEQSTYWQTQNKAYTELLTGIRVCLDSSYIHPLPLWYIATHLFTSYVSSPQIPRPHSLVISFFFSLLVEIANNMWVSCQMRFATWQKSSVFCVLMVISHR